MFPRLAYSYIRFSSGKQSQGDSQRRQTELRDSLLAKHGWVLDTTLNIQDLGKSAFKGERQGLAAFLAAIKEGRGVRWQCVDCRKAG